LVLATLTTSPVLTPLVVERMGDTLPPKVRHRLLRIFGRMVKECYGPVSGTEFVGWEDSFRSGLDRFVLLRRDLLLALMESFPDPGEVLAEVQETLLDVETEWLRGKDTLGLGRDRMKRFLRALRAHERIAEGVLRAARSDSFVKGVFEVGTHPAYLAALLQHATVADYSTTGVLMAWEGEVPMESGSAVLLADRGMDALQRWDAHLSLLTSTESFRDAACRSAMAQWSLVPPAGGRVPKAGFEEDPIPLHGESLSELVVRERR
jgi:hypothetical protein